MPRRVGLEKRLNGAVGSDHAEEVCRCIESDHVAVATAGAFLHGRHWWVVEKTVRHRFVFYI